MSQSSVDPSFSLGDYSDVSIDTVGAQSETSRLFASPSPIRRPHIRDDARSRFGAASRPSRSDSPCTDAANIFEQMELGEDKDTYTVDCDSKPAASDDRIQIDLNRTKVGHLYHMICPEIIMKGSNSYAVFSMKVAPAYVDHMSVEVLQCGRKAQITFAVPPTFQNASFLVGAQVREEDTNNIL